MKSYKWRLTFIALFFSSMASAQFSLVPGTGISSYYGDLKQSVAPFDQISGSGGLGFMFKPASLPFPLNRFRVNGEVNYIRIGAKDSKNDRADIKARNLSFISSVWNGNLGLSFDMLNPNKVIITPYPIISAGVIYFDPYAIKNGKKEYLQPLGTEGQGLAGEPDKYKRTAFVSVFGMGARATIKGVTIGLEFKYWKTNTDYLDDVSRFGYPDKAKLDASNVKIASFTWRGDEVGTGPYPVSPATQARLGEGLNRGNPNKNDGFTTFQVKIGIPLGGAKAKGLLTSTAESAEKKAKKQCEKDRKRIKGELAKLESKLQYYPCIPPNFDGLRKQEEDLTNGINKLSDYTANLIYYLNVLHSRNALNKNKVATDEALKQMMPKNIDTLSLSKEFGNDPEFMVKIMLKMSSISNDKQDLFDKRNDITSTIDNNKRQFELCMIGRGVTSESYEAALAAYKTTKQEIEERKKALQDLEAICPEKK